ncbi:MAG TPA: ATP-binding protein [Dehalococcoidia bacterium]|nr:ATP-binding protein [Dehalococcoidia bacterium]
MMESLGDILKRNLTLKSTSGDTATSSKNKNIEEAKKDECPLCKGRGWLCFDVPFGHPDFDKLVPCQCTQREFDKERLSRLEHYSNLGPLTRFTFDNLLPRGRSSDPQNHERFAQSHEVAKGFAENPKGWLVLSGPSGCGKTHLAAAIANYRLQIGHPVFFVTVPDLLDHLRTTFSPSSDVTYDELFERVRSAPLLLLDDLGRQSSTPWAAEKLFQILNHRFNAELPTVVTISDIKNLDERLAVRLQNPAIAQICELEKALLPLFQQIGGLNMQFLEDKTFEAFDTRGMNADERGRESLQTAFTEARRFAESPKDWLVFLGVHGCGKTHLAAAIANHQLRGGKPVFFAVVPDLLDHLRSTFSPESKVTYDELFEKVKTSPLLILDDLGTESSTPWAQEKLYQILNYRYNSRLSTVITVAGFLEGIEGRLASRLQDPKLSNVITIFAPDYRSQTRTSEDSKSSRQKPRRWR